MLMKSSNRAQEKNEIKNKESVFLKPKNKPMQQPAFMSPPPIVLLMKKGMPNVIKANKKPAKIDEKKLEYENSGLFLLKINK